MNQIRNIVQAIDRIFNAQSVAVVGASKDPNKFGYMTMNSIIQGGYEGKLYPVNPKADKILGFKAYPTIKQIPERIDIVVVVVPAKFVPDVLKDAAGKGAYGAIIQTAGFSEAGRPDLEKEILSIAKDTGLRLLGPNIQGINYLPNKLCAMFFPVIKTKGPLAVVTQSGTITAALSEWAERDGLGISAAVNLGNQIDLCEADYIDYFLQEPNTKAIILYIESVKNGRRLLKTLQRASLSKGIAILKSGRTAAGAKSAASHTGKMAGSFALFSSACSQFGVPVTGDLETLYDYGEALATMKQPRGDRILIISTSGGAATLACDEAESKGLKIPNLSEKLVKDLKKLDLSPLAHFANPIDLASTMINHFETTAMLADKHEIADIILISFGDPVVGAVDVVKRLADTITASLAISYIGGGAEEIEARIELQKLGIPVFASPERAIRGISAAVQVARYRKFQSEEHLIDLSVKIKKNLTTSQKKRFVPEPKAIDYLEHYKIPYPIHGLANTALEAGAIANGLGYPVVLKVVSPDISHKSEFGGVCTNLNDYDQVCHEFERLINHIKLTAPAASLEGALVCKQVPDGFDVIIGSFHDSVFGPTIMFGMGGIYTEIFQDVSFRIAPLRHKEALEMIHEIKGFPLLTGLRGRTGYDIDKLADLITTISSLVIESPKIVEMDLNPVRLFHSGLVVLDVRIIEVDY